MDRILGGVAVNQAVTARTQEDEVAISVALVLT